MRLLFLSLGFLLLAPTESYAQDGLHVPSEPPEWGEVSPELLRVDDYPADSNASAVILSDVGDGSFQPNGEIEIEVHTQIKILDEDGYDMGTVTIPFYAEDQMQDVNDVEGVTYTLENGKVQKHELNQDDVFEEDIDGDYKQVKFTMPRLEPGAVMEYEYELDSKSWMYIPSWSFQHGEPTLYSEYRVRIPSFLQYTVLTTGAQNYDTVNTEQNQKVNYTELDKRWVMKEVPALREEPYVTTLEDYRSRIRLQIKALRNPVTGAIEERFMSSWEDLAKTQLEADHFGKGLGDGGGGLFGGEGAVETEVKRLTEGASSDSAEMHAIYEYVRSSIEWNGRTSRGRSKDFEEILETQTGNSAEVNLLLVTLLQNAGLEAHPVLISTRDHGKPFPLYPFVNQFNSIIAAVKLPDWDQRVLLDATEPFCPVSMLPERDLNRKGWLVRKGNPEWVKIPAPRHTHRQVYVKGKLQEDGTLSGKISVTDTGFRALASRRTLQDKDSTSFVREDLLDGMAEVSLSNVSIENKTDLRKSVKTTVRFNSPGYAQGAGGMMYLNPRLMPTYVENPLKQKERKFPVDFAYPRKNTYTLSLQLPEGYKVKETPPARQIRLPNKEGQYVRLIQAQGRTLMIRSTMEIRAPRVPANRYQGLRELFTRVVSAQSKQVVLENAETQTTSPGNEGEE